MFKVRYTLKFTRIPRLRDLYPRARRNLEARIQQNVIPRVEADVVNLLAPAPGPAVYPFQFATDKSRRFYFWKFSGQIPYVRSGALAAAWHATSTVLNGSLIQRLVGFIQQQAVGNVIFITVYNDDPAATYVYGPRQVPGHAATGWGQIIDTNGPVVVDNAKQYVRDEWGTAVRDAMEET